MKSVSLLGFKTSNSAEPGVDGTGSTKAPGGSLVAVVGEAYPHFSTQTHGFFYFEDTAPYKGLLSSS